MPFRWSGFPPDYAATTTRICNRGQSTGPHGPTSTQPPRPPTTREIYSRSEVSAIDFSPDHFRGPQARQVSCYALFEEWLLLSLSSCCLGSRTPFSLTLSRYLGALTSVWVVPLSVMRLTPHKPASGLLMRRHLRSSKRKWDLSIPCFHIGALQRRLHPTRPGCDPLRWELAITALDWLLAPCPRLGDRVARQDPFGPPPGFRPASSYPGHDRAVSSLTAMTQGPFRPLPLQPEGCCRKLVSLRFRAFNP